MNDKSLQNDILKEIFNISIGKAASLLSEIINKRILLTIPNIEILKVEDSKIKLNKGFPKTLDGTLMVSSITFKNKLDGKANLIFPAKKMRRFINLCANNEQDTDENDMNFTDIDFDIIKEIGNIILNSIVGEFGNYIDVDLSYTLPEVKVFNVIDFNKDIDDKKYSYALMLYITFIIDDTEIEGAIMVEFTLESLNKIIQKVGEIEGNLDGQDFI